MPANAKTKEPPTMRPTETVTARQRLGAAPRALASLAALAVVGVLIAGCGGGGKSPGVANVSSTSTSSSHTSSSSTTNGGSALGGGGPSTSSGGGAPRSGFAIATGNPQKALKLSQCMRAHGVPNFPDPNGQGVIQGSGIDPNSRQFQKAQQTCAKNLGGGLGTRSPAQIAQAKAAALAFSKCMRSHGVPAFPDPQFGPGGGIRIRIGGPIGGGNNGLDPNSQIFKKAQQSCGSLLPGRAGKLGP
jgi:hypothetical protein